MARRKTRKTKSIVIDRIKIAITLLIVGVGFFFAKTVAPGSPLFTAYTWPSYMLFGELGSNIFFGGIIAYAILIFFKKSLFNKWFSWKCLFLLIIVLSIISFPLLENETIPFEQLGGGLGWLGLKGASMVLGGQILAIKILLFALAIGFGLWILYSMEVKVPTPKIKFQLGEVESKSGANSNTPAPAKADTPAKQKRSIFKKPAFLGGEKTTQPVAKATPETESREKAASALKRMIEKDSMKKQIQDKIAAKEMQQMNMNFPEDKPAFPLSLMEAPDENGGDIDEEYLTDKSLAIQNKLEEFGITVDIVGYNIGPTVIQIKIKPQAGIKISRIEGLKKDLSLGLRTKSIRILAPIPGTSTVGIEIPNPKPRIVRIKEIMSSGEFTDGLKKNLTNLSVGIGIDGKIIVKKLDEMPHLLIAGATGSGKSVGVNDFITSLIYQNTPSELKFIMIDPKQVELSIYEGIPYLLAPIITDADKSLKVLKRAVQEMNTRYQTLKKNKVRNFDEFNTKMSKKDRMYRIVIVIDELADLMMSKNKKDTETAITRIAQMARAVGIHLIIATQRPSVNVITGLIKANVPTRIAFGVVSQVDSRTILDMKGAEDLVGRGDLLYIDPNNKFPVRIQAPFVSTTETEKIVWEVKEKYMKNISEQEIYNPEIINILEAKVETAGGIAGGNDGDDELVNQAIDIISQTRKASATLLQRKLGIGFARAARIMDILEEKGVVGPQEGAKPREILI